MTLLLVLFRSAVANVIVVARAAIFQVDSSDIALTIENDNRLKVSCRDSDTVSTYDVTTNANKRGQTRRAAELVAHTLCKLDYLCTLL